MFASCPVPLRICIFGQKNHGKSTLANMLIESLNRKIVFPSDPNGINHNLRQTFDRIGFASPIKRIIQLVYDLSNEQIEEYKNIETPPPGCSVNVRTMLQKIGTMFREFNRNTWVRMIDEAERNLVIDDGRFENELDYAKKNGWMTILLKRPTYVNPSVHQHESETYLIKLYKLFDDKVRLGGFGINWTVENRSLKQLALIAEDIAQYTINKMKDGGYIQ